MASLPLTLVHQLNAQADRLKDRPCLWHRRGGRWQTVSWQKLAQRVRQFALGLMSMGFGRGQALLVVGQGREEWALGSLGAMAVGGVAVSVDPSVDPERIASVAAHCEATVALVEGPATLASIASALSRAPLVQHIVLMDAAPQRAQGVRSLAEIIEFGSRGDDADFYAALEAVKGVEVAQLIYGEGPGLEAAMLTHRNLSWTASQLSLTYSAGEDDVLLACASVSTAAGQLAALHLPLLAGAQVYFGQGPQLVTEDLLEVRPSIFVGSSAAWEAIETKAEALAAAPAAREPLLSWARPVARRFHLEAQRHQPPALGLQGQYALARRLVLGPLKDQLGLNRGRLFVTTEAIPRPDFFERLASLDVAVAELHGQAEATGIVSVNTPGSIKFGTQGRPLLGVEVKVAPDGEVLVRGDNVCAGYLNDQRATEALLRGGWLHSGEQGALDEEGFLSTTGPSNRFSSEI